MARRRTKPDPTPTAGVPPELYRPNHPQWFADLPGHPRAVGTIAAARTRHRAAVAAFCTEHGLFNRWGQPRLPPRPRQTPRGT